MPHGGGGGSAGGGFHGGSHGGSGSRSNTISHTYFPGAKRYRYRKGNGQYDYVYMRHAPGKAEIITIVITFCAVIGLLGFSLVAIMLSDKIAPEKLKGSYVSPDSHIEGYEYLDNTEDLEEALEDFEDLTGVCPVVYAVYNDDWEDYKDLEDYAYDLYVDNYDDEEHFMIVYSIDPEDAGDWYWESMIGDDTDDILTDSKVEKFGKALQKKLASGTEPGLALTETFEDSLDYIMAAPADSGDKGVPPVMIFVIIIFIAAMGLTLVQYTRKYERVDENGNPIEDTDEPVIKEYTPLANPKQQKSAGAIAIAAVAIFFVPFIMVGIKLLTQGIDELTSGSSKLPVVLIMGVIWNMVIVIGIVSVIKRIRKANKLKEDPEVTKAKAESFKNSQRQAAPSVSQYPAPEAMDKPEEEKMNAFEKAQVYDESLIDAALNRESHVDYDDEDYERMKKDGFE